MIKRSGADEVLHEVVSHNGVLYLAGITAEDTSLDMAGQTEQVLDQLASLLAAHGSGIDRLLSAMVFITHMSLKPEMNRVWTKRIRPEDLPSRATIGVSELGDGILIELVATAAAAE